MRAERERIAKLVFYMCAVAGPTPTLSRRAFRMSLGRLIIAISVSIYISLYHFRGLNPLGGTLESVAI